MLGTLSCTRALSASAPDASAAFAWPLPEAPARPPAPRLPRPPRAPAPSDHTLLEQALSNLVDNAIRYNRSGGHVAGLRAEIRHREAAQG
jgi:signal transduction histidine kinase